MEGNGARTHPRGATLVLVIDASVALSWSIADEGDVEAISLLKQVASEGAIVPALWTFEMENGLRNAHRRGRITDAEAVSIQTKLVTLPIQVVDSTDRVAFHGALGLANKFDLSVYDAAYLDVALRHKGHLATLDDKLMSAAEKLGVAHKTSRRRPQRPRRR